jgi:hypothetical protein
MARIGVWEGPDLLLREEGVANIALGQALRPRQH